MKFRKRPGIVEAVQFHADQPWPEGVEPAELQHNLPRDRDYWPAGAPVVVTTHGQTMLVADGDWIIQEPDGVHFYPCKPDVFAETYESADSQPMAVSGILQRPEERWIDLGVLTSALKKVLPEELRAIVIAACVDALSRRGRHEDP